MLLGDVGPNKEYQLVEIRIFAPISAGEYPVELSVQAWRDFPQAILRLDQVSLTALDADPKAYGLALGKALFADEVLGRAYRETLAVAHGRSKGLRVRLRLDVPELNIIHWERIYHPLNGGWLHCPVNVAIEDNVHLFHDLLWQT